MAELKTQKNDGDVAGFLNSVEHDKRREDSLVVLELMQDVTGEKPKMWGGSIVGFGEYHPFLLKIRLILIKFISNSNENPLLY